MASASGSLEAPRCERRCVVRIVFVRLLDGAPSHSAITMRSQSIILPQCIQLLRSQKRHPNTVVGCLVIVSRVFCLIFVKRLLTPRMHHNSEF
jgi:hypothetical protein